MYYSSKTLLTFLLLPSAEGTTKRGVHRPLKAPSCEGLCGSFIDGGSCQCDNRCNEAGDCCVDFVPLCLPKASPPQAPAPLRPDSCQARCFLSAEQTIRSFEAASEKASGPKQYAAS